MFYTYNQNNTGGVFDYEEHKLTNYVIIEAPNSTVANAKAVQELGMYWDGASEGGPDCPCCGDRWYPTDEHYATETPTIYGEPVEDYEPMINWMGNRPGAIVHYANGSTREFVFSNR